MALDDDDGIAANGAIWSTEGASEFHIGQSPRTLLSLPAALNINGSRRHRRQMSTRGSLCSVRKFKGPLLHRLDHSLKRRMRSRAETRRMGYIYKSGLAGTWLPGSVHPSFQASQGHYGTIVTHGLLGPYEIGTCFKLIFLKFYT